MAEENAAPAEDTPQPPAQEAPQPDSQQGTPGEQQAQTDWEQRYQNLQPEYTRATQELSQYQQVIDALHSDDPQLRQAAAEALDLEFVGEEPSPEDTPEAPQTDPRLDEVWQAHQAQQEQAYQLDQAGTTYEALAAVLGQEGRQAGDAEDPATRLMFDRAFDLVVAGVDPQQAAQEAIGLVDEALQASAQGQSPGGTQWAKSKSVSTPAVGQEAGDPGLPLDAPHGDRVAHMVSQLQANEQ